MLPLATVADVETRLGRSLGGSDLSRAEALLEDASELVRSEADRDWIDPDTGLLVDVPGSIRTLVLRMVDRAMRNPEGFSAESDGDYSYQRIQVQSGGVYLTDREIGIIRRALKRSGLWTQQVTRGDVWCETIWVDDEYGCEPFPIGVYYGDY